MARPVRPEMIANSVIDLFSSVPIEREQMVGHRPPPHPVPFHQSGPAATPARQINADGAGGPKLDGPGERHRETNKREVLTVCVEIIIGGIGSGIAIRELLL